MLVSIVCLLSACQTSSETVLIQKRCAVHGKPMFLGSPQVSTFPFLYVTTSESKQAAKEQFPNAGPKFAIGCFPNLRPQRLPRVKYCEECRAAEIEWFRSHRAETRATELVNFTGVEQHRHLQKVPRRKPQSYSCTGTARFSSM